MKEQRKQTITHVFPAEMVEAVLAQLLGQLKNSMDCIIAPPLDEKGKKSLSDLDNMKATLVTCMIESRDLIDMLAPYSNAALREHHRLAREIILSFRGWLETNQEAVQKARATHARPCAEFARRLVHFVSAFHTVLHSKVDIKDKEEVAQEYLGYLPAAGAQGRALN